MNSRIVSMTVRGALTALGLFIVGMTGTFEGTHKNAAGLHVAYQDLIGVWTAGFGETKDIGPNTTMTDKEAVERLIKRLVEDFEPAVFKCAGTDLPDGVHAAFVSLFYNIGTGAGCSSTAARRARARDWAGACEALTWFNRVGKNVVAGLVKRRTKEREICDKGIPANYTPPAWLRDYAKGGPAPANDNVITKDVPVKRRVHHPDPNGIKENPPPAKPAREVPKVKPPVEKCTLFGFYCWKEAA